MKKIIIGSIVGGIIIFLWQFLSWAAANFHEPVQKYTEKQDAIMTFLNAQNLEDGGYYMPTLPRTASKDEWNNLMKESEGKPWALLHYHREMKNNQNTMIMNMIRALVINILTVYLLCWILRRFNILTFGNVLTASLVSGMIVYFNAHYIHYIWYEDADIWIHLLDAIASWALVGLWLGWWLTRRKDPLITETETVRR